MTVTLRFVTIRAGLAALCAVGALVACSEEAAAPPPLPSATSSSPAPIALPVPPEATPETPQGAEAFARYFLLVVGEAFKSADASRLKALSAPGCGGCDALISSVEGLREQGRKRVGGDYTVKTAAAPPVENGDVIVEVSYERAAAQVLDQQGQVTASAAPVPTTNAQMRLVRVDGAWRVQGYRVTEP